MPINTDANTSDAAAKHTAPVKIRKARGTRKTTGSASSRGAAPRVPAAKEILFDELPNPYHLTAPPFIWVDHPEQHERLLGPVYVIRLGVGGADRVELSIDGGVWKDCRLTSGYWWYDWSAIRPGRHTLVARMRTPDGRWFRTPTRNCEYRP